MHDYWSITDRIEEQAEEQERLARLDGETGDECGECGHFTLHLSPDGASGYCSWCAGQGVS